jgi:hypothetical protein
MPVEDEFQIRRARFQSKESQPSFLEQKDYTQLLLDKLENRFLN